MKRIYRIDYEEKWTGCKDWTADHINASGNGDAFAAIAKVRRNRLAQSFRDEKGKVQRCTRFRWTGAQLIASAEL